MSMKKARGSQKGIAILTATVILIIIAGLAAAFLMLSFNQSKFIAESSESEATLQICEAGVEDCINKLQAYADKWKVNKATPIAPSGISASADYYCFADPLQATATSFTFTGTMNGGTWTVTVQNNKGTAPVFPSPFAYPATNNPIWFVVTSSGTHGKMNRTLQVLTSAVNNNSTFKGGLFGDVEVDALGTFNSDGYDSSAGTYASQATNSTPGGKAYAEANGNIGSNGNIITGGNVEIMGNANPGPGKALSGGGYVSGSTTPSLSVENLPVPNAQIPLTAVPVEGTAVTAAPGWTSGNKTIGAGGPSTATPTVYHWSDIDPSGPGTLTVNGNVDIYVDGLIDMNNNQNLNIGLGSDGKPYTVRVYQNSSTAGLTINGQAIAGSGAAKNFQIYSKTTGDIMLNGGSTVYAAINAPKAYFKNNGGNHLYGSVTASRMFLSGTAYFTYDRDLQNLVPPEPKFKIVSWRETAHLP